MPTFEFARVLSHAHPVLRVCALAGLALAALPACGGGAPPVPVGGRFTPEDNRLFSDGVDFVADPEALEGRWRQEWSDDLQGRIGGADVVARVTVHTLRTDVDPGRHTTYRLIVRVDDVLLGAVGDDLTLTSSEDEAGYRTIEGNDHRLLQQPFVCFLKWERADAESEAVPHFHLSPATDPVAQRVAYLLERRRGVARERPTRTIIVHQN